MSGVLAKALGRSGVHGKVRLQGLFLDRSRELDEMLENMTEIEAKSGP